MPGREYINTHPEMAVATSPIAISITLFLPLLNDNLSKEKLADR
jgi:hypothetical protein